MDDLLNHAQQLANLAPTPIIQSVEGRVAYLVNQGHGTANDNTQQFAEALNQQGFETLCMVRPSDAEGEVITPESDINGVRYLRSELASVVDGNDLVTLESAVEQLIKSFRIYRPEAVIAETVEMGLTAWVAAERSGISFYFLVRNANKLSDHASIKESELEAFIAKKSSATFAIDVHLRDELVNQGVSLEKVVLSPNVRKGSFSQGSIVKKHIDCREGLKNSNSKEIFSLDAENVKEEIKKNVSSYTFKVRGKLLISCFSLIAGQPIAQNHAIFGVQFFNAEGQCLEDLNAKEYGYSYSEAYGNYKYLTAVSDGVGYKLVIKVPSNASYCTVRIGHKNGVEVKTAKKPVFSFVNLNIDAESLLSFAEMANIETLRHVEQLFEEYAIGIEHSVGLLEGLKSLPPVSKFSAEAFRYLWRLSNDPYLYEMARQRYVFQGRMYEVKDLVGELSKSFSGKLSKNATRRLDDDIYLFENGFPFPKKVNAPAYESENNVLYLLHNRLPYNSGGYATRTHGLLTGVQKVGDYKMHGVSRPGYPSDHVMHISQPLPSPIPTVDIVDDIEYFSLDQKVRRSSLTTSEYIEVYAREVEKVAKSKNASIIHAAANYPNGLAASLAARRLGIKSIYEVRGLWEITRLSRQEGWDKTDQFHFMAKMEAEACNAADAVITITEALKDLMIERGVDASKITVVPNCVHTDLFSPLEKSQDLARELGIQENDVVIGYIGSIVNYEGLDDLLKALALLVKDGITKFKFLLVGDGAVLDELKEQVKELELQRYVIFTGRVPHEEVQSYYSLVDITPFPRKPYLVCEAVSPLKPFEAMASQKAVIVSSCAALTEIIEDGYNGLVFEKGNVLSFKNTIKKLIVDEKLRRELSANGRDWVIDHRDWSHSSKVVDLLYSKTLEEVV